MRVRASAVCVEAGRLLTVRATDPVSGRRYLFLPGGAIEPGESAVAAAERETLEETGYAVRATAAGAVQHDYSFVWAGRAYACRTTFVSAVLADPAAGPAVVSDADYLGAAEWLDLARVAEAFDYHDVIRRAVLGLMR